MDAPSFVRQLLDLPDERAWNGFLQEHQAQLTDEVARALKAQADHYLRADIRRSLQIADLMHTMSELTGSPSQRALGLLAEANARSIGLGEYQRGIELYDEAAAIYRAQGRLAEQARSQVGKIGALGNLGRYEEALQIGHWARDVLAAHGEKWPQATVIMNMAVMYGRLGEIGKSLEMANQALEVYRQLGKDGEAGQGGVQMNRANQLRSLGRFEESIQASQAAREILTRLGQRVEAARARQSLALTYFVQGRYNEALAELDQVRGVFLDDGRQRDAMLVELFISDCLLQLRRFADVLDKCRQVRSLFAGLGARYVVAQAIVNEAVAYAELGRYPEALQSLAEARGTFDAEGNRAWVASTDLEISAVLLRQGNNEDCLSVALKCARAFAEHDLPVEEAHALLVAARAALALGRLDEAQELASEALKQGEKRNLPAVTYRCHYVLGMRAAARKDPRSALTEYDQAIRDVERLRGRLMVEFRVGFLEDKEVIYQDAGEACLSLEQAERGLDYAERAKSRALLDLLAQRLDLGIQTRDASDRPLVDQLIRLREQRDQLYRRWESDAESATRGWTSSTGERQQAQQDVLALEKQITDLWHRLLVHNADYAREAALWSVRTEPIRPYLAPGTLLLEYFIVHGRLVAFLVTRNAVRSVRLPGALARIQHLVQLLWLNLKAVPRSAPGHIARLEDNALGLLRELHRLLVDPLAGALSEAQHVIVVPHGALHYLPFHALHDGESYMIERREVSYLPGGSFLRYCREAPITGSGLVAVGHSHGGRLPHAVQEARAIASLLNGRFLEEDDATLSRIREAVADGRIVHLAAHGDFRADNPLFSGLAFADGWLTTLDIFSLRLKASLVSLSACQTGRNVVGSGDELLGLMRAFLSAGAASLALTLWAVEDRSTAQMMEMFYRKLAEGRTKGAALRAAQLCFVENSPRRDPAAAAYSHPYFWAPFFLVGDAGPL